MVRKKKLNFNLLNQITKSYDEQEIKKKINKKAYNIVYSFIVYNNLQKLSKLYFSLKLCEVAKFSDDII